MPDPASDIPAEMRRIVGLAWPVVLTSLNWTILGVTDVVVVGLVGAHEVAALGASRSLTFVGIVTGFSWLTAVLVHASRADGAGDDAGAARSLREGLVLGLALGLVSAFVLLVFAAPLLRGIGVAPAIVPAAATVVRVMALAYPFQLVSIAASFFLEGVSRPKRVTAINLATLPINAVLAWALSGGHLGLPAWGAAGAAAATAVASMLGAAGMVWSAYQVYPKHRSWRGVLTGVPVLTRFGVAPAVSSGLELVGFSILIALSTRFGDAVAHAFQVVFSVHNVTFSIALGLGSAAGVRAGNAVGEGRGYEATGRTMIAVALTIACLGVGTVALIVWTEPIVDAFPGTAAAHEVARAMLPVWAPFILFDGVQVVLVYALRSLGDQVMTGVNSVLAYFVVTGGAGLWLVHIGVGPMALVWASGIGMVAAAALHGGRFWRISARLRRRS